VMNDSVKKVDAFFGGVDRAEEGAGCSELEIQNLKQKNQPKLVFSGLIKSRLLTATGSAQTG
jgi:hypothetical protein